MDKRKIVAMYFSATGTTEKVVDTVATVLANILQTDMDNIDFTLPEARGKEYTFSEKDLVIFGTPVIAGRVPNVLLKFLDTIKGCGALVVPIVVYGNRNYDDALIELRNILERDGFHTVAAGAFIGEHSFSKTLGANRPDVEDLLIAKSFAEKIAKKLQNEDLGNEPVEVRGETPLRGYYQPRDRQGKPVDIRKVKPKTKDNCNKCGLCAKVCPMGSIDTENLNEFKGICIKCGACVKKCPQQAKYYDDANYLYHKDELEKEFGRRSDVEIFL